MLLTHLSLAQSATIRGFVRDDASGEPLIGVNVVLEGDESRLIGATTDSDGIFSISGIRPRPYLIRLTYVGYETVTDSVLLLPGRVEIANFRLKEATTTIEEIVVEDQRIISGMVQSAGLQTIRPSDIDRVPTPDVSGDLVNFLTTLPGVVTVGDRGGQMFVRGGEPAHNLFQIDGIQIVKPFHVLGFYSAFPSELISQAEFNASGYGVPYSGRVSSVLDVHTRNGDKRKLRGSASISPLLAATHVEGPLLRDQISFLASVRESVLGQGANRYTDPPLPYRFGDRFGKIHWIISDNHVISFTGFHTYDRGTIGDDPEDKVLDEIRWSNAAFGLRYVFLPRSAPFFGEILLSYSSMNSETGPSDEPVREASLSGFNYAVNMTHHIGNVEWKWGVFWRAPDASHHLGGTFQNVNFGSNRRHKAGMYAQPTWSLDNGLKLQAGLIAQLFPDQDNRTFVEPRVKIIWQKGDHELNAAFGLHHQEVFGIHDRRDATNVFTAWAGAPTDHLSRATHSLLGYRVSPMKSVTLSAEAYHKDLYNLYIPEWTSFPTFTTNLQRARGRVYGLDTRIELITEDVYAYVNYGLSSVNYWVDNEWYELWYGSHKLEFRPPHDRRHQINLLCSTNIRGFDVSLRWNFGSGRPYSRVYGFDRFVFMDQIVDIFNLQDQRRVIYGLPFDGVLPAYHRLDVSVDRDFVFSETTLTLHGSITNLYDRDNIFSLDTYTQHRTNQIPFFPSVGIKVAFR